MVETAGGVERVWSGTRDDGVRGVSEGEAETGARRIDGAHSERWCVSEEWGGRIGWGRMLMVLDRQVHSSAPHRFTCVRTTTASSRPVKAVGSSPRPPGSSPGSPPRSPPCPTPTTHLRLELLELCVLARLVLLDLLCRLTPRVLELLHAVLPRLLDDLGGLLLGLEEGLDALRVGSLGGVSGCVPKTGGWSASPLRWDENEEEGYER